jgi:Anti-sigma factor NepR
MNRRKVQPIQPYLEVEVAPKKLSSDIKARIGQQLRAMYSDVVNQGVPERFAEILRKLDEKGSGAAPAPQEGPSPNESSPDENSKPNEQADGPV